MAVLLQQVDRRTKLGILLMDVLLTEEVSFDSEVSAYPVEDGTEISDHITQGAKRINITGMIATADASGGWGMLANLGLATNRESQEAKIIDVIEALEKMHKGRELVKVSTGQMVYDEMAFVKMTAQRASGGGQGNWINISAELIKVRKVKLKTADVPPPENVSGDAAGRAGETNKPAGKTTANQRGGASNTAPAAPRGVPDSIAIGMRDGTPNTISGMIGRTVKAGAGL